jgi:hypothetical protein
MRQGGKTVKGRVYAGPARRDCLLKKALSATRRKTKSEDPKKKRW